MVNCNLYFTIARADKKSVQNISEGFGLEKFEHSNMNLVSDLSKEELDEVFCSYYAVCILVC